MFWRYYKKKKGVILPKHTEQEGNSFKRNRSNSTGGNRRAEDKVKTEETGEGGEVFQLG